MEDINNQRQNDKLNYSDLKSFQVKLVAMAIGIVIVLTIIGVLVFFSVLKILNVS